MILEGNQRGGAKNLALHLLKDENEHVEVFEMRGFVSDNLVSAFQESYAISRGTKCTQHLFSLSLNPPANEKVSTDTFEDAIARVEAKFGLQDQPRAIVFHEKQGRRHAHAVWCRIDGDEMKAIPLPFHKRKLMDISREMFIEQGWDMPPGMMNSEERDPTNYTLAQWQQAKRAGKDPKAIKSAFQDAWTISDSQPAFAAALKERGYTLARGDRRGFVGIDHKGEVFAVSKWTGLRTKQVREKLTDAETLPSMTEAKQTLATAMAKNLETLKTQQDSVIAQRKRALAQNREALTRKHDDAREEQAKQQAQRERDEALARQQRFNSGLRGFFDRFTGRHKKLVQQSEREAYEAAIRDRQEKDALIFEQLETRQSLQRRIERLDNFRQLQSQSLSHDISQYHDMRQGLRETFNASPKPDTSSRPQPRAGPELTM